MADDTMTLELVSPERLLLSEPVEMVIVPGVDGDFGVRPGHAPLLSNVRPGVIAVFENGKVRRRIFVAGGFAEVAAGRCTLLADAAMPVEEIDRAAVEEELADQKDALARADAAEQDRLEKKIAVSKAKIDALTTQVYR